jgi:uncharacterized protein YggE
MKKGLFIGILITVICVALPGYAPAQQEQATKTISVSSIGTAKAKPDVTVVIMEIRATAPLAKDALQECTQRVNDIKAKLKALGIQDENVRFSGTQYAPAGSIRGVISTSMMRSTGFDVTNTFEVLVKDIDPSKADELNARVSSLLDELSKAGASVITSPISSISLGGNSAVSFAILNPDKYERQAYEAAIEKARPVADEIARKMGVQITGIDSVRSSVQQNTQLVARSGYGLDMPDFAYFSSSPDEITIRANVTVSYTFK